MPGVRCFYYRNDVGGTAMLERWRYKFTQFMQGRNGMDDLARAESGLTIALLIASMIISLIFGRFAGAAPVLFILEVMWIALFIHLYFRMFSRNLAKRSAENQKFCNFRYRMTVRADRRKKEWAQRKTYRFYRCPQCRQRVRVPRGRGKICITCPKCRNEFVKRS
jgi:uncharacterized protein YacL